jgi:hypothetical protein
VGKSVTVLGKCYAISDSDRQDDPISFVALILSLIISKQRVTSSMSPLLTEEAPC